MQNALSVAQPSQVDAARETLDMLESGLLFVTDEPTDYSEDPALVQIGGIGWARMCELSRRNNGRVLDFLPKIDFTGSRLTLSSETAALLVNCRTVLESSRSLGALSADDYASCLKKLGTEGEQPPLGASIPRNTMLFCHGTMAKLLSGAKLLRPVCRVFRLFVPREDINDL